MMTETETTILSQEATYRELRQAALVAERKTAKVQTKPGKMRNLSTDVSMFENLELNYAIGTSFGAEN